MSLSANTPSSPSALPPVPGTPEELARISPVQWSEVLSAAPERAATWMFAAARLGSADAQAILGQWLLDGKGLQRNPEEAFKWFQKAAFQGHAMGMNMAGRCLENGWGIPVDLPAATDWYARAARKGLDVGMYNYANQLASGQAVPRDDVQALRWYQEAARLGHAKSFTKIGGFYEDGRTTAKDGPTAMGYYRKGAEGGDFRGQFNYAGMLAEQGQLSEALRWLRLVPLTATPDFLARAGRMLVQSPVAELRAVGQQMLGETTATTDGAGKNFEAVADALTSEIAALDARLSGYTPLPLPPHTATASRQAIAETVVPHHDSSSELHLRHYQAKDLAAVAQVFTDAVHGLAGSHYGPSQRNAWAPKPPDLAVWAARLQGLTTLLAESERGLAGFLSFASNGHIDLLFTAPRHARHGVASALYAHAERALQAQGVNELFTEASLVSRPFFEKHGYRVEEEQVVLRNGVKLDRFAMRKRL
ncbi:GNAT family N-acetyltransferase [Variovorax sp. HJSM1_2]|uniref:GNAT family N-acetyltransferase n=1 Tax=Variovorax sp. HJSM1_2 TaxID=3366263 RepID=UPI003BE8C1FF